MNPATRPHFRQSPPHQEIAQEAVGVLPSQALGRLIHTGQIKATEPFDDGQLQPASIDLRLGPRAYRVRASFLPGKENTVRQRMQSLTMHEFDLTHGAVLERDCVYIVPLMESVALASDYSAVGNPKSSTGRLDVFTRLITDHGVEFDQVPAGYSGALYAEISPRTFSVLVRKGSRLSQLRVRRGSPRRSDEQHIRLQREHRVIDTALTPQDIKNGVPVTVDVEGSANGLIGYRAKSHAGLIDVDKANHYPVADFWDPVYRQKRFRADPGPWRILYPGLTGSGAGARRIRGRNDSLRHAGGRVSSPLCRVFRSRIR